MVPKVLIVQCLQYLRTFVKYIFIHKELYKEIKRLFFAVYRVHGAAHQVYIYTLVADCLVPDAFLHGEMRPSTLAV